MRARRTVGQMAIAGLTLLGALVLLALFAQAAFPGRDGQIAYGTVESVYEIGVLGFGPIKAVTPNDPQHPTVLVEGKGLQPPGATEAQVEAPSYSADGQQIAFAARWTPAGGFQSEGRIFTMSASGADVHQLTTEPGVTDSDPGFSPSGEQIVFDRTEAVSGATQIYRVDAHGTGLLQLTKDPNGDDGLHATHPMAKRSSLTPTRESKRSAQVEALATCWWQSRRVKAYEADFSPNGKLIVFVKETPRKGGFLSLKQTEKTPDSCRQAEGRRWMRQVLCPGGPVFCRWKRILYEQENTYNSFLAEVSVAASGVKATNSTCRAGTNLSDHLGSRSLSILPAIRAKFGLVRRAHNREGLGSNPAAAIGNGPGNRAFSFSRPRSFPGSGGGY